MERKKWLSLWIIWIGIWIHFVSLASTLQLEAPNFYPSAPAQVKLCSFSHFHPCAHQFCLCLRRLRDIICRQVLFSIFYYKIHWRISSTDRLSLWFIVIIKSYLYTTVSTKTQICLIGKSGLRCDTSQTWNPKTDFDSRSVISSSQI